MLKGERELQDVGIYYTNTESASISQKAKGMSWHESEGMDLPVT